MDEDLIEVQNSIAETALLDHVDDDYTELDTGFTDLLNLFEAECQNSYKIKQYMTDLTDYMSSFNSFAIFAIH